MWKITGVVFGLAGLYTGAYMLLPGRSWPRQRKHITRSSELYALNWIVMPKMRSCDVGDHENPWTWYIKRQTSEIRNEPSIVLFCMNIITVWLSITSLALPSSFCSFHIHFCNCFTISVSILGHHCVSFLSMCMSASQEREFLFFILPGTLYMK